MPPVLFGRMPYDVKGRTLLPPVYEGNKVKASEADPLTAWIRYGSNQDVIRLIERCTSIVNTNDLFRFSAGRCRSDKPWSWSPGNMHTPMANFNLVRIYKTTLKDSSRITRLYEFIQSHIQVMARYVTRADNSFTPRNLETAQMKIPQSPFHQVNQPKKVYTLFASQSFDLIFPNMAEFHAPMISIKRIEFVYDLLGKIVVVGAGIYGRAYLGKMANKLVCIKLIFLANSHISNLIHEAGLGWRLNESDATPRTHGLIYVNGGSTYHNYGIVSDFIGHDKWPYTVMDLHTLLKMDVKKRQLKGFPFVMNHVWQKLLSHLAEKLAVIHRNGLIVNDLKSDNILMQKRGRRWVPFIIDFGMGAIGERPMNIAFPESSIANWTRFLQSYPYIAPEILHTKRAMVSSDIYALGNVFNEVSSKLPELSHKLLPIVAMCHDQDYAVRPPAEFVAMALRKKGPKYAHKPSPLYHVRKRIHVHPKMEI